MPDIWNDPIKTEGVQADPPAATPSEEVKPATTETPAAETPAKSEAESVETKPTAEATTEQVKDEATPTTEGDQSPEEPNVKREARRVFFKVRDELGGESIVDEAVDVLKTIQDSSVDAKAKLHKLYATAPRAYEDLRKEMFFSALDEIPGQKDAVVADIFGPGVTIEQIKNLLGGQVAPSSELPAELPDDTSLPDWAKAKLQRLDEIEKRLPELETTVNTFSETQKQAQQEKALNLGREFVQEAMQPVFRMMREAGLEVLPTDSPEEKAWKEEVWDTITFKTWSEVTTSPANKQFADDIETFISKLDRSSAWGKMRTAQARAEQAASKRIELYTSNRQKQREAQTSVLTKDQPPVIAGGQTSFGSTTPPLTGRQVWDDPNEVDRWKDIAASVG